MFWVNLSLNDLFNYPYLSHTLQTFKDLFDPKCCAFPTSVESDMPNKPMESYTLTMGVRDPHSTQALLIPSKLQLARGERLHKHTHLRTLV